MVNLGRIYCKKEVHSIHSKQPWVTRQDINIISRFTLGKVYMVHKVDEDGIHITDNQGSERFFTFNRFSQCFYTESEMRKMKLNKLNG